MKPSRKPRKTLAGSKKTSSAKTTGSAKKAGPAVPRVRRRPSPASPASGSSRTSLRIGQGYDVHPLVPGRRLILGGVDVPHTKGLQGHSDADALAHAVCDALLGAVGEGDLGRHFPSSNPAYKDISSLRLLEEVCALVADHRCRIVNVDCTIIAQAPRLGGYLAAMASTMAGVMGIDVSRVNVKVKSGEGLGAVGREEGLATLAVCLIEAVPAQ